MKLGFELLIDLAAPETVIVMGEGRLSSCGKPYRDFFKRGADQEETYAAFAEEIRNFLEGHRTVEVKYPPEGNHGEKHFTFYARLSAHN